MFTLLRVVGSCCIRLRTTANAHATHPNIIRPTMLEVVVSVADSQDLGTAAAAAKTSLKKRIRVLSIFIFDFPQSLTFSNVGELSWSWISKNHNHVPEERERKFCRPLFAFSTKREIRHFYVVVERWRQRNHVQKNLDARPTLLFSLLKVFLFWRSRCRRGRRLLRSLFTPRCNYTLQHLSFSERRYICLLSNKRPVIIILGICSDWKASDVTTASVFFTISIF